MSEQPISHRFCTRPTPPERLKSSIGTLALNLTRKRWLNDTELTYIFVDAQRRHISTPDSYLSIQLRIVRLAWESWKNVGINLTFKEVTDPNEATIFISFEPGSSWSYVGLDNKGTLPTYQTMNFGWDLRLQANTAEHEIGHALGLEHEHQNPDAGIVWDEPKVYRWGQETQYWDQATVRHNIIDKVRGAEGTSWDKDSIMHYPFEAGLILNPAEFKTKPLIPASSNCHYDEKKDHLVSGLSERDREFIRQLYPLSTAAATVLEANSDVDVAHNVPPSLQLDFAFRPTHAGPWDFKLYSKVANSPDVAALSALPPGGIIVRKKNASYFEESNGVGDGVLRTSLEPDVEYTVSVLLPEKPQHGLSFKATKGELV